MDQVMNISDWYLFQGFCAVVGFQRVVGPTLLGLTPDEALIEATMPKGHEVFAELSRLLGSEPFFCGEALSLADILVAAQMDMLTGIPEWTVLTNGRANLAEWLERMNRLACMQATTWPKVTEMAAHPETSAM
jgi:glutathione S-transferase